MSRIPTRRQVKREKLERREIERTSVYASRRSLVLKRPETNPGRVEWWRLSEPVRKPVFPERGPDRLAREEPGETCIHVRRGHDWWRLRKLGGGRVAVQGREAGKRRTFERDIAGANRLLVKLHAAGYRKN
jgi:hypothetical protein